MAHVENSTISESKYKDNPLASLWAANESFSGSFLHALNLPFKGLYLSAFSVYILALLNQFYNKKGVCIAAGLKVSAVKFAVNPFASINSHFAVMIQSSIGELYRTIKIHLFLRLLFFSLFVLSFSAFQRLFTLWLFFGMSLYNALNIFSAKIISDMTGSGFSTLPDISYLLITLYFLTHIAAAIPFAMFCYTAINRLESALEHDKDTLVKYKEFDASQNSLRIKHKPGKFYLIYAGILLLFIAASFYSGEGNQILNISLILLRFIGALLLFKFAKYIYRKYINNITDNQPAAEKALWEANRIYRYLRFAAKETAGRVWYKRIRDVIVLLTLLTITCSGAEGESEPTGGLPLQPPV